MTRSTMLEEIRQDYVRTARSKGVPEKKVIYGHALKNALLPVITTIGSAFGAILGGSVIAESVFNLPGLGSLIVLSIKAKDTPSVLASVLLLAVFFALIMLIVDLVYAFIDPRKKRHSWTTLPCRARVATAALQIFGSVWYETRAQWLVWCCWESLSCWPFLPMCCSINLR